MQKVSLTFHDITKAEALELLKKGTEATANAIEANVADEAPTRAPKKTAPKRAKPAPVDDEPSDEEMGLEDDSVEDDDNYDLPGSDEDTVEDETEDKYTLKDITLAFKAYRESYSDKAKGIEATKAIMKKLKIKSAEELKKQDYPAVMKMLAVKKKK